MAIDVGFPAIYRGRNTGAGYTRYFLENPANATGTITQAEVFCNPGCTKLKIGVGYITSGTTIAPRGYTTLGNVSGGAKQTFTGLSIPCQTGDIAGNYSDTNVLDYDIGSGSDDQYYVSGDYIESTQSYTFEAASKVRISLYMTGTETATGHPTIKRLGGVPYAALNRGVF